jgi:predicted outer membrane repeat protein
MNNGGCLTNSFSRMYVSNSTFQGCEAKGKGGMLFATETFDQVLTNCTVTKSYSDIGSVISAYLNKNFGAIWKIDHCVFSNNTSENELMQVTETAIVITNCVFSHSTYNIFTVTDLEMTVKDSIFTNISCFQNFFGCLFLAIRCKMTITGVFAENIFNQVESAGFFITESDLILSDCVLRNFSTNMDIAFIFGQFYSNIDLSNNLLYHFRLSGLSISESRLKITDSTFDNRKLEMPLSGSAISCIFCTEVALYNTYFSSIKGKLGGALYISGENPQDGVVSTVLVSGCKFESNTAAKGGAIYITGGISNITNSSFIINRASDSGGGIYYLTTKSGLESSLAVLHNNFNNNYAFEGSTMKWAYVRPLYVSNKVVSLQEDPSNDLVSFPVSLRVRVKANQSADENMTLLQEIPPGLPLKFEFKLEVIDTYQDRFQRAQDSAFSITVRKHINSSGSNIDELFLFGENSIRVTDGIIDLSGLNIAGRENSTAFIFFSFEGIPEYYKNYLIFENENIDKPVGLNINGQYLLRIPIKFRTCRSGEIFNEKTLTCALCPIGKFSFSPKEDCKRCPDGKKAL